MIQSLNKI